MKEVKDASGKTSKPEWEEWDEGELSGDEYQDMNEDEVYTYIVGLVQRNRRPQPQAGSTTATQATSLLNSNT